jgi:uncharacterized protein (TIGR03067 family)
MRPLCILLLSALPLVAAPVPKAVRKASASLDGSWRMVAAERNGKLDPPPEKDYNLWVVAGDTMQLVREKDDSKEGVYACQFISGVNEGGLRTFEYVVHANKHHRRGVCEQDGDTLRVAFSHDTDTPPAEVKGGKRVTVFHFQRVTDPK